MTTTPTPIGRRPELGGRFAPVPDEIDAVDLPVEGHLPPELAGRYLRNGPNARPGDEPGHLFTAHGMLHGVRLRDGRAEWYRNRWVRTRALEGHPFLSEAGVDLTAVPANTHVISHAGRLFALVENGLPYEVDRDLGTRGPCDFDGRLTTAMTAHPKTDPTTGDLHFFGYSPFPPFLTYHRLSADGRSLTSRTVEVAGPTMMHDFAITAEHVVWLDLPMTFQWERMTTGMPFGWDDSYGARLGVMRQDDPDAARDLVRRRPRLRLPRGRRAHRRRRPRRRRRRPLRPGRRRRHVGRRACRPCRGRPGGGRSGHRRRPHAPLGPRPGRRVGHRDGAGGPRRRSSRPSTNRSWAARRATATPSPTVARPGSGRARWSSSTPTGPCAATSSARTSWRARPCSSRPTRPIVREDDGWLLTITTRRDGSASQLLVLDATDVAGPAVATVTLPRGVPSGFHGSWIPDAALLA